MAAAKTRRAPNVADPLRESTPGRRVHAAYLAAGYTRAEFTRALGVSYVTVDNWDKGQTIRLENLMRAAETLGYSMDELCYGHQPPPRKRRGPKSRSGRPQPLAMVQALRAVEEALRMLRRALNLNEQSSAAKPRRKISTASASGTRKAGTAPKRTRSYAAASRRRSPKTRV
jgi:transcriptional regulator with XRE-family HTH domain